jgi:hypothetical protein
MGSLAHVFVPRDHPRYPSLAAWSETSRRKFWKFGKSSDGWDGIWVARGVWDPDPLFMSQIGEVAAKVAKEAAE